MSTGGVCSDSGVHSDLWLLWGEQTGGGSGGAEAMAVVQVDSDGELGFLPQESLGAGAQIR